MQILPVGLQAPPCYVDRSMVSLVGFILSGFLLTLHAPSFAETIEVRPRPHLHEKLHGRDCRQALLGRWAEDFSLQLSDYIQADRANHPRRPLLLNLSSVAKTEEQRNLIEQTLKNKFQVLDFSRTTGLDDVILETALLSSPENIFQLDRVLAQTADPVLQFNSVFDMALHHQPAPPIAFVGAVGTLNLPEADRAAVWGRLTSCCKPLLIAFDEAEVNANLRLAKALHWQSHNVQFLNNEPEHSMPLPRHAELPDVGYDMIYDETAIHTMEGFLLSNYPVYQHSLKALYRLSGDPKDPKINTKKLEPGLESRFHASPLFRSVVTHGPGGYRLIWTYAGDHKIRVVDIVEHNSIE